MGVLVTTRKEVRESRKCGITCTTGSLIDQSEMGHVVLLRSSAFSRFLSTHPNHIRHALRIKQASRLRTSDSLRPPRLRCTRVHTRCDSHRQCVCQWIISPPIAPVDFRELITFHNSGRHTGLASVACHVPRLLAGENGSANILCEMAIIPSSAEPSYHGYRFARSQRHVPIVVLTPSLAPTGIESSRFYWNLNYYQ